MKKKIFMLALAAIIIFASGCQETATVPEVTEKSPVVTASQDNNSELEVLALKEEAIKLMNARKFDEALAVIDKAIEMEPRADLFSKKADIYVSQDKHEEAENVLKKALTIVVRDDRKALIYGQLADVYNAHGKDNESLEAVREFEKLEPQLPENAFKELPVVYGTVGVILADHGENDKAIKFISKSLEKEPGQSRLLFERGLAYYKSGETEKARTDIKEWLKTNPSVESAKDLALMSNAYVILAEYDKGLDFINKAIAKDPKNFSFYNDRAGIYILKGDKKAAKKDLDKVLDKYPDESNWERKMALKQLEKIK